MSKYMLSAFVAFALVLSSCSNTTQPASPDQPRAANTQKATSVWYEIENGGIWNPCCNEILNITGKYHVVSKGDGSGYKLNTAKMTGTDAAGNTYHGTLNYSYSFNDDGTYRFQQHTVFTSPTGCSFMYKQSSHLEIDENGNYVYVVDNEEIVCL